MLYPNNNPLKARATIPARILISSLNVIPIDSFVIACLTVSKSKDSFAIIWLLALFHSFFMTVACFGGVVCSSGYLYFFPNVRFNKTGKWGKLYLEKNCFHGWCTNYSTKDHNCSSPDSWVSLHEIHLLSRNGRYFYCN